MEGRMFVRGLTLALVFVVVLIFVLGFIGSAYAKKASTSSPSGSSGGSSGSTITGQATSASDSKETGKTNSKDTDKSSTKSKAPSKGAEAPVAITTAETSEEPDSEVSEHKKEDKPVKKQETEHTYIDENQNTIKVTVRTETKERNGEIFQKIKVRGVEAVSDLELESENGKFKTKLSNGNYKEIKVMPNTASETALEKLKTNKGLNIQLKEVGQGNDLSVVYDIEGNRTVKFLGLFKVRTQLNARINAETGEITEFETPWWYFFVGKEVVVPKCDPENLDLCETQEECEANTGYWYDAVCNIDPQIVCSLEHLELCVEEDCGIVGGYWYNNSCNPEPQIIIPTEPITNETVV
ncbi:hypothetical protein KY337_06490 [Candidatus Woesearchaeota archaeon]|nr:hypothetical protein [Candidatus Woesearchaeota archaeon]